MCHYYDFNKSLKCQKQIYMYGASQCVTEANF